MKKLLRTLPAAIGLALLAACGSSSDSTPGANASPAPAAVPQGPPPTKIARDVVVLIDYTLTDPAGKQIDSSVGKEPLAYIQGYGNIVPGLEKALEGRAKGDTFKVTIPPEEGYGKRSEDRVKTLPRAQFNGPAEITVGMEFSSRSGPVKVTKVDGDNITIDANHPLADMPLTFEVTVKELRHATAEELTHKHPHGPGGAH